MSIYAKRLVPAKDAMGVFSRIVHESMVIEGTGGITRSLRDKYRQDPLGFSRDILGNDPYSTQEEIINSVRDNARTSVRSCHGVGKTWSAADIALWFLSCYVPSTVVTTAPTSRQVRDILWKEINAQYSRAKSPLGGRILIQQLTMSTTMKWFATGFSTDEYNVDAFQGFHNDNMLVIVDEACGVSPNIFAAIEGLLSSGQMARLLLIGNPNDANTEFGKSQSSSLYKKFHMCAFDCPNFTELGITLEDIRTTKETENGLVGSWVEKMRDPLPRPYLVNPRWVAERWIEWGEESPLWKVRVMGEFPEESETSLIPLSWVERAQQQNFLPEGIKGIGVDIARSGMDESVLCFRKGKVVFPMKMWYKQDTMHSVGMIKKEIEAEEPDIVNIDVIGIGAGVVDRLKEIGFDVNGVNVGESSRDKEKYANLRAQLYWDLREKLSKGELQLPDDDLVLASELVGFEYSYTSRGQLKLELKEKTKRRIGKSPDRSDALVLSLYERRSNVAVGNLSGISEEAEAKQPDTFESKLGKVYALYRKDYTKNRLVCNECNSSVGVVYSNPSGNALPENATKAKCLMCGKVWDLTKKEEESNA